MAPAILWQPEEAGIPASIWEPGGPEEVEAAFCELASFDDSEIEAAIIADYTFGTMFPGDITDIDGELIDYVFAGSPSGLAWQGSAEVIDGALVVPTTAISLSEDFGPEPNLAPYAIIRVGFSSFVEEDFEASIIVSSENFSHTVSFTQVAGGFSVGSSASAEDTEEHGTTTGLDVCAWHELEVIVAPGEVVMTIDGGTPTVNETTTHVYPNDESLNVSIVSDVANALRISYLTLSTLPPA